MDRYISTIRGESASSKEWSPTPVEVVDPETASLKRLAVIYHKV